MAWPFTPLVTYLSRSVPKVTAAFLNSLQAAINAVARPMYGSRIDCRIGSLNGSSLSLQYAPAMILDSATSQYVFVEPSDVVSVTVANLLPTAGSWPASTWLYVYLTSTNAVPSIVVREDGPNRTPFSDGVPFGLFGITSGSTPGECFRYLGCFRTDGSNQIVPFSSVNGKFDWLTPIYVLSSASGSTSFASVDVSAAVPGTALRARYQVALTDDGSVINLVRLRPQGVSYFGWSVCDIKNGLVAVKATEPVVVPDHNLEWRTAAAHGSVDIAAHGFEEW